jgi:hypothetical protein
MSSRFHVVVLAIMIATFTCTSTGIALEKSLSRLVDAERDQWRSGMTSCLISYHNTCTGWIWVWQGWSPQDRFGTQFYRAYPESSATLNTTYVFFDVGSPAGYGFDGTIDVWAADPSFCPSGAPLASQPLLPLSGWNTLNFGVPVPASFVITYTLGPGAANPVGPATDHPAAGPTGPQACGMCYPSTRNIHSFYFGPPSGRYCPGSMLADTICNTELVWEVDVLYPFAAVDCNRTVAVEETSWGQIKSLYR